MTLTELRRKVLSGEGQQIEFKRKLSQPDKILKEIVAFANADGGLLFIGVEDNKMIYGVKDVDEITNVMSKNIEDLIAPKVKYSMEIIPVSSKRSVVVYNIFRGKNKPYFLNPTSKNRTGIAYYRYKDMSIKASPELLKIIRYKKNSKKGFLFTYSDNNKIAMQLVHRNNSLTLSELQRESGMKKYTASVTLTNLVLANILQLIPRENEDLFIETQIK
jgi:predicted HTH transcriptional regulator